MARAQAKPTIAKPRWKINNATSSHFGINDASSAPTPRSAASVNNHNKHSLLLFSSRYATAATPTTQAPPTVPTHIATAAHTNANTNDSQGNANDDPILLLLCSAAAASTPDATHIPATARPPDNGDADASADDIIITDRPPDVPGGPPSKARKLNHTDAVQTASPTALRAHYVSSDFTSSASASGSLSADLDFTSVGFRGLRSPPLQFRSTYSPPLLLPRSRGGRFVRHCFPAPRY